MSSRDRKLEQRTYQEQIIVEASLQDRAYSYNKIQPSAFFWKQLTATSTQTPLCLVPDTLVLNEKDTELMWIFTDEQGRIRRQTNINFKDFISKLTSFSSPNELVAILKRPIFNQKLTYSNDFKLLNSRYLLNSSQQQMGQKDQVICLQRFIKSNGAKAFLCRTIFSANKSSQCYLITNSRGFYDKNQPENKKFIVKPSDKTSIVKSKQGKNLEQTLKYLKQIVQYLMFFRGIQISELVGDFIKDQMGNWWLINVKAFKAIEKIKKNPKSKNFISTNEQLEKQRYQKTKMCRYCQKSYLQSQLTFKMTMRMIIQVDKYLLHMGKQYNWLKRSDISNIDSHCLYQEHKVCSRCFRLYTEIQQLMQIQKKFLIKQGCQQIQPKQLIFSQTNEQHLRLQAKNKQIYRLANGMPQMIELGPNTNITIKDKCPVKNDQIINKMIRFRLIIFLNEIDEVVDVSPCFNYYLQFSLFNKKMKYKLNTSLAHQKIIPLNKLKVFYFFANSIENLQQQYIVSNPSLKMFIVSQHKQTLQRKNIGNLQLFFKDFIIPINSKRDFYKFFHIENVAYGWGIEGSIGIIPSQGQVTTSKIAFQRSEGQIYVPNESYYFCQHLTEEWIDLIKTKNIKVLNQRSLLKSTKISQIRQKDKNNSHSLQNYKSRESLLISKVETQQAELYYPLKQINNKESINQEYQLPSQDTWKKIIENQIKTYESKGKRIKKNKILH